MGYAPSSAQWRASKFRSDGLDGVCLLTASTRTSPDGRYVLCGLENDASTYVFAVKTGYRMFERATAIDGKTTLDIELRR